MSIFLGFGDVFRLEWCVGAVGEMDGAIHTAYGENSTIMSVSREDGSEPHVGSHLIVASAGVSIEEKGIYCRASLVSMS